MKKARIAIVNIAIMVGILIFVILYSSYEGKAALRRQVESFVSTTVAMEHVTENYMVGEQHICDVWARYINSKGMSIEEAASFIRISHVTQTASAHIVYLDTLSGLSTRARQDAADDYAVSYERIGLLNDVSWINDIGKSVNISRAYTNPVNGEQSIAFCNYVTLQDSETGELRDAVLLRVLPIAEMAQKWIFPQEGFENTELSMIDANGDYIIKGHSFKNSSFFEFYRSYNTIDPASAQEFFETITSSTGSFTMLNSRGEKCILAYTPVDATGGWTLLSFMPMKDLRVNTENWLLIGVISAALLLLFVFDLSVMLNFNKNLQAAAREAASANRAKTDFLSTMSHDIRTPMNAIIGYTKLALKEPASAELHNYLVKIDRSNQHLLTLINDILEMSRIENGKMELEIIPADLCGIFRDLYDLFEAQMEQKKMQFEIQTDQIRDRYVLCDVKNLNRVLINLLNNAYKFTPENGHIIASIKQTECADTGTGAYEIRITDNGIGMSKEFAEKMFRPFERERTSTVSGIEGTGLGLSISKSIIDLMDGTIEVLTEPDCGTEIVLRLRFQLAEASDPEQTDADDETAEPFDTSGKRLLLVEDNAINMEIVNMILTQAGYAVENAENGQIALDMISGSADGYYDAVLMDIQMPVMDGYTATGKIRSLENKALAEIPILAMTANAFKEDADAAIEAGMQAHIAKPIDADLLLKTLAAILSRK